MILNCPNCQTRYLVPSAAIGVEGREVRCAKCSYEWFQDPSEETSLENSYEEDVQQGLNASIDEPQDKFEEDSYNEKSELSAPKKDQPIPDSIKPVPEGSNVPAMAEDVIAREAGLQAKLTGYGAALLFFVAVIGVGLIYKNQVITTWPPSALIYNLAGFPANLKGEGLIVETLSATVMKDEEERDILILKGKVTNLSDKTLHIPQMMAILRSTNGEDRQSWMIDPPVDQVKPQASFSFTSDYSSVPKGVGSVNLTFVPEIDEG